MCVHVRAAEKIHVDTQNSPKKGKNGSNMRIYGFHGTNANRHKESAVGHRTVCSVNNDKKIQTIPLAMTSLEALFSRGYCSECVDNAA